MRKSVKSEVTTQWGTPLAIMILAILALLINFCLKGHAMVEKNVEDSVLRRVEGYSGYLYQELENMTSMAVPLCGLISQYPINNQEFVSDIAKSLQDSSAASMVAITNINGKGVTETKEDIDLSDESYFDPKLVKQKYYYIEKEGIRGEQSIVSVLPIYTQNKDVIKGFMFLYYPIDRFTEIFKETLYIEDTFFLLTLDDGQIIEKTGYNLDFIKEKNLNALFARNNKEGVIASRNIKVNSSGSLIVSDASREVYLVYTPLGINGWYFTTGMSNTSIENLVKTDWRVMGRTASNLIIIVVAFFILVVVVNILNKIKYTQHSRNLEQKADTDLLTELYNKIATEREIENYTKNNQGANGLLFLIDIDNFKKINDSMGHAFGDEVLRTIGRRLRLEFRKADILGRIGGDEMVIFLKDIKDEETLRQEAARVAKIYQDIQVGEYVKYKVTASIGTAVFSLDGKNFQELYTAADKALYLAKKRGKNQMAFCREQLFVSQTLPD